MLDDSDEESNGDNEAMQKLAKALRNEKTPKLQRLDMVQWTLAFESFALAAHACEMWTYTATRAHLRICLQVAAEASHENKRHILGQFYDEICRKEWAVRAERGDADFDIEAACLGVDHELLKRARHKYTLELETKPKGGQKGHPSSKGAAKGVKRSSNNNWNQGSGYNNNWSQGSNSSWKKHKQR